jgi:hypothetical protein
MVQPSDILIALLMGCICAAVGDSMAQLHEPDRAVYAVLCLLLGFGVSLGCLAWERFTS